ncbi:substrate-binding domain-containing protein [Agrobacterium rhizogenes]|nr:substrate-binding domain-containing protein [Rhizobium rhizogenes]NTJ80043.1 substrate-binding domain-containing protein [Rhizobium rhizogenes]
MKLKTLTKVMLAAAAFALAAGQSHAANIAVIAGSAQDAFFNAVKKGVDDATTIVKAHGGSVSYMTVPNYDNFGPDLVGLINTAISQNVQGIAIPIWVPEAQIPALKEAAKKGIKIMLYNTRTGDKSQDAIGLNYFGTDEAVAGNAGGAYLAKQGAKKILCVIQVPGAVNLETRCKGVGDGAKAGGAEVEPLRLPSSVQSDMAGTAEAIKAELLKDPSIDAVMTLGAQTADAAAMGIQQAGVGDKVKLGTFDLSASVLDRIKSGQQLMAIDQQPYLQSFFATTALAANIDYGMEIPTNPVLTGPAIVDTSNIGAALNGVQNGVR